MTGEAYTESINLMDYSAVVIPITKADKNIDIPEKGFTPASDVDALNWEACKSHCDVGKWLNVMKSVLDDPEIYDGAPVGVQIVARKYEEEKIWAIGKIVHAILETAKASER